MSSHNINSVPATVRHISKNHVTIAPAKGFEVTVWTVTDGEIEATVSDGDETVRLRIDPPGKGQSVTIKKHVPTGIVDITYEDKR